MDGENKLINNFTEGSIPKHLLSFSVPLFIGNILQALYNTVDSIWVGRFLGPQALAAVSVSFPIIFILVALITGITMATTVMVAQYVGAKKIDMVKKAVGNSLFLLIIASIIASAAGILLNKTLLRLINTPEEILPMASGYANIIFTGLIFMFGYNMTSAILRGLGDSRTPLRFLFYSTMINIVLDPIMIFGLGPIPKMGIQGAALATILSQAISFVLALRYLDKNGHVISYKLQDIRYDSELTRLTIKIGLPAGIQQTVVALGNTLIMSIVNGFGVNVVAAFNAAQKLDSFAFMPSMSIGMATSTLTGQNMGAGKTERVKEVARWSEIIAILITGIITAVFLLIPDKLLLLFTTDREVLSLGAQCLRILAISYVPFGLMWTFNGIIRGAGDTLITMIISMISLWVVRIPLSAYLSKTGLAQNGIWIGMASGSILSAILSYAYYRSGRWKRNAIVRHSPDDKALENIDDVDLNFQE
ncbi:MAG: MATE family efflux transporter [Thermoanaerobacteraceae bacterium]|nr:MATE family efflux transporter [Thermoanaerobacteraceae bacterium]